MGRSGREGGLTRTTKKEGTQTLAESAARGTEWTVTNRRDEKALLPAWRARARSFPRASERDVGARKTCQIPSLQSFSFFLSFFVPFDSQVFFLPPFLKTFDIFHSNGFYNSLLSTIFANVWSHPPFKGGGK